MSKSALKVHNLTKAYREKMAVRGVSFSANFGQITAVLGPNGAGKTTTIECCEGLRDPDFGEIKILGEDPQHAPSFVRSRIGVMLQDGGLPMAVPAGTVLTHVQRLYGQRARGRRDALIERLELGDHLKTPVRRLSGGNRQKLALACALIGQPEVLFLDEPTAGMDAYVRVAVHNLIDEVRRAGTAIVLTTHLLDEAEYLADHIILMASGRIEAQGSVSDITASSKSGIEMLCSAISKTKQENPALLIGLQNALGASYDIEPTKKPNGGRPDFSHAWRITPAPDPAAFAMLAAYLASVNVRVDEVRQLTDLTSIFLELASEKSGEK